MDEPLQPEPQQGPPELPQTAPGTASQLTLAPIPRWIQVDIVLHEQEHGPLPDPVSTQGQHLVTRPSTPVLPLQITHSDFLCKLEDSFSRLAWRQEARCKRYGKTIAEEWPSEHTPPHIVQSYHEKRARDFILLMTPDPMGDKYIPQDIGLPDTQQWREFFRDAQENIESWHPKWGSCPLPDQTIENDCSTIPSKSATVPTNALDSGARRGHAVAAVEDVPSLCTQKDDPTSLSSCATVCETTPWHGHKRRHSQTEDVEHETRSYSSEDDRWTPLTPAFTLTPEVATLMHRVKRRHSQTEEDPAMMEDRNVKLPKLVLTELQRPTSCEGDTHI